MSYRAYEVASKTNTAGRRIYDGTELAHLNEAAIGSSEQVHARSAGWERPRTMFGRRLANFSISHALIEAAHALVEYFATLLLTPIHMALKPSRPSPTAKRCPA